MDPETQARLAHLKRMTLSMKAVYIQVLDAENKPLGPIGSGFLRREKDGLFLYTCWHVITGYDMHDLRVLQPPDRRALRLYLQAADRPQPGIERIGGQQSIDVPLYDMNTEPPTPLWTQDSLDKPHPDLNAIGIRVPASHDAIKLRLPADLSVSDLQVIDESDLFNENRLLAPGEKVLIVGYPYGFSALGLTQPTPIVLTKFIAATRITDRSDEILLDGAGAPGMSGGPAFLERDGRLELLGLYTGLIFPDHPFPKRERATALGVCNNLALWWVFGDKFMK